MCAYMCVGLCLSSSYPLLHDHDGGRQNNLQEITGLVVKSLCITQDFFHNHQRNLYCKAMISVTVRLIVNTCSEWCLDQFLLNRHFLVKVILS